MRSARRFDVAVIGGGPAGLVAALAAARRGRVVLVLDRMPAQDGPVRIDVIPARTLALLTEFGIRPGALGVNRLMACRWMSWETAEPVWQPNAQTAHLERPSLERELFRIVGEAGIMVIVDRSRLTMTNGFAGEGWRAEHLIDASGRAAITARERFRPRLPWASRFFWTTRQATRAAPEFRIAALAEGYAYRLGSAQRIGMGIVGRGNLMKAQKSSLEPVLKRSGAGWLLEDMPPFATMVRGAAGIASVQWSKPGFAARAGDAAVARDSLSSQGLAMSISDALYAVAALGEREQLERRHEAGLAAHLIALDELLAQCRFGDEPVFRAYRSFLQKHKQIRSTAAQPTLRQGRIMSGDPLRETTDPASLRSSYQNSF
jgi:hypothetical protein